MARQSRNGRSLGFVDTLWKAADKLRGSMNASEYKRVVLGIVFPKYIDGAFTERRAKLVADLAEEVITADHDADLLPSGDEYDENHGNSPRAITEIPQSGVVSLSTLGGGHTPFLNAEACSR